MSNADTKQKSAKAFEILVRENTPMLRVYLRALVKDEAGIDDLYQETMVVAWRRLDDCDLSKPFGPWLRGIASRLVMAYYRKRKKHPIVIDQQILSQVEQQFTHISTQLGDTWDDKVAALNECLSKLPDNQKQVIQSKYLNDFTIQQVANLHQVTLEACKKRLQRARGKLAQCLKQKGIFSPKGAAS